MKDLVKRVDAAAKAAGFSLTVLTDEVDGKTVNEHWTKGLAGVGVSFKETAKGADLQVQVYVTLPPPN